MRSAPSASAPRKGAPLAPPDWTQRLEHGHTTIAEALRGAGYRTGLYTSPHLVQLNERIRVRGAEISDDTLLELIRFIEPHATAVAKGYGDVTFFEYTTALAFEHFRREEARIVVLETGMGGRLDATNVVTPLLSVITRIGIEHSEYLGDDLASIAGEKAGIIKRGRPVVCGDMDEMSLGVLRQYAREKGSRLVTAAASVSVTRMSQTLSGQKLKAEGAGSGYPPFVLSLLGRHQLENCATVLTAIEEIASSAQLEINERAVVDGLASVEWQGRGQVLSEAPPMILDGAHNPSAAGPLAQTIKELAGKRPVGLVVGMCKGKDAAGFLRPFSPLVKRCWAVSLQDERRLPREELALLASRYGWTVSGEDLSVALVEAEEWAKENDGLICITGSLYLVGEVLMQRNGKG